MDPILTEYVFNATWEKSRFGEGLLLLIKQPHLCKAFLSNRTWGETPLSYCLDTRNAFKNADYQIASILINAGANVDQVTSYNDTVLLRAWYHKNQDAAIKIIVQFEANIGKSASLFFAHHKNKSEYQHIPAQIELTEKSLPTIKANLLGINMGRLFFSKHSELDLKVATFLFKANSLEMLAFKAGREKIRTLLALSTLTPKTMTFMRHAFNEVKWRQWQAKYNANLDHPYGPGAMVPYKGNRIAK